MKNKLSKKIIIILLVILLLIGVGRILKVKGYIPKYPIYTALVKMGVINYCYSALVDMLDIFQQEGFDYEEKNKEIVLSSLNKLKDNNIKPSDIPKVPTITHKIYFTSPDSQVVLNDFYLEELKLNYNKLNSLGVEWQHYIWTNKVELFPQEITSIKGVKVKTIDEFKQHPAYSNLTDLIEKGSALRPYFAQASDLLRLVAIQKYGGIYSDLDYEIYNQAALFDLMKKFDFLAGRELPDRFSFYGNAFLAAKSNHPVINEAVTRSVGNYDTDIKDNNSPLYLRYPCNNYDKLYFNGPVLITISYFSKNNINGNNDVILPPWMVFNLNFARLKNNTGLVDVKEQECDYSAITKENFEKNNHNFEFMLKNYIENITIKDWRKYYDFKVLGLENSKYHDHENNIYYKLDYRKDFDVIGADMFCGSWTFGGKVFKRKYYWKWNEN